MDLTETVQTEIHWRFAEADREPVRTLLSTCRSEAVCIAILRLSRGKLAKLEDLVVAAKRDYRDVLAWASQPRWKYIVGLLRKGPNWGPEDERVSTHLSHAILQGWKKSGAILVGGWFVDFGDPRGMYIFVLDSVEEVETLVQSDPAVQSGKLAFELHPWVAPAGLRITPANEL